MSDFGVTFVWCAGQVAAIGVFAALIHGMLRWYGRSIAPVISFAAIVVSIWLVSTALGPWPSYLDWIELEAWTTALRPDPETGAAPLGPSERQPVSTVMLDSARTAILELSATDSQSMISQWPWSRVISLLFVVGLSLGLAHLAVGVTVVHLRLRRSHPVRDRRLVRLVEQLRREMGCTRPVQIRVAYDLATAATVGWSEPVILIPADWRTWTLNERRAVLAHEMAHIVNNDYLAVLISQVGLALHFYHPSVHWLARQLRLDQEFAADAIAAEHAGGRQEYLKTLALMALRKSAESGLMLERAFLPDNGMLMQRISMLRERRRPTRPLSTRSQALIIASLLLFGLAASGVRQPTNAAIWTESLLAAPTLNSMPAEPVRQATTRTTASQREAARDRAASGSHRQAIDGCNEQSSSSRRSPQCRNANRVGGIGRDS